MALYEAKGVSFVYPAAAQNALQDINLILNRGDFALFCGPTGSGKTTLLRLLKKEVQPVGKLCGSMLYEGLSLEKLQQRRGAEEIAMVFQDPDEQIIMETVWQELTFAMENMGYATGIIQRRLAEVVNYFGMESWLSSSVHQLSGGQKQLLNLASVMMLHPKVLLLDEPTAQLDPVASKDFLQTVHRVNQEFSITVILSEHRLEEVYPLATQVFILEDGRIKYRGSPTGVIQQVWSRKDEGFMEYLPSVSRLFLSLNGTANNGTKAPPLNVRDARNWIEKSNPSFKNNLEDNHPKPEKTDHELIACRDIYYQYERDKPLVLKRLSLSVSTGDFYALLGGNGSGKTTLLKLITGIIQPQRGKVLLDGQNVYKIKQDERRKRIGHLAQNPSLYFNRDTVEAQLKDRAERLGLGRNSEPLEKIITFFNLENIMKQHPYDLSGGQRQKMALALVLMSEPELVLLDEPTKGLDPLWKLQFAEMLQELQKQGTTILMVSHDIEFTARYAQKCALLFAGQIIAPDTPRNFFSQNFFYTTVIQRVLGDKLPQAVNIEDVNV